MPNRRPPPNPLVACLLYDGLASFEFGIAAEVFGLARPEMGPAWYRFVSCAEEIRPLRAVGGVQVTPEAGLDRLARAGTVVVPGWRTDETPPSPALAQALRSALASGGRLVTICSGAFLPASMGLLDGRPATTHWRYADRLQALHPAVQVAPERLYVDDGDILTSAGSSAGIDLLLHLVRKDHGAEAANAVARRLVTPPHRDGDQAQYVERPVPARADGRLAPLLHEVRDRLGERWTVTSLASEAMMSERTLIRHVQAATGLSPGAWLIRLRVEAARDLLERSSAPLDDIAQSTGFGSLATLRHHFRTRVGVSPAAYRARFKAAAS